MNEWKLFIIHTLQASYSTIKTVYNIPLKWVVLSLNIMINIFFNVLGDPKDVVMNPRRAPMYFSIQKIYKRFTSSGNQFLFL